MRRGLGRATPAEGAWISGGSPTEGWLANAPTGPLVGMYTSIAGSAWADWLFMLGLVGIGVALLLRIGTRIATVAGAALMGHLIYAGLLFLLLALGASNVGGLGRQWKSLPIVQRFPVLR